jgi:DNA-binding transcriptional regulator YiaG
MSFADALADALALKRVHNLARRGKLAELREGTGLSQSDVARALGVHQSSVARWESAESRPRPDHAVALLELLDD